MVKDTEAKNIFSKDLSQDVIESIIKKNWSLCLGWFFKYANTFNTFYTTNFLS